MSLPTMLTESVTSEVRGAACQLDAENLAEGDCHFGLDGDDGGIVAAGELRVDRAHCCGLRACSMDDSVAFYALFLRDVAHASFLRWCIWAARDCV